MLSRLSITNYAIIDHLEIDFAANLNIITGETGAGKSIIVGALGLILGQRADSQVLLDKNKKCVVEGNFKTEIANTAVQDFLAQHELDQQDEIMVRREIAVNGKSRAFINDTPVNLSQLNHLSSLLVDLHQQFDTLSITSSDFQREVLDALAGNSSLLKTYRQLYSAMSSTSQHLTSLQKQKTEFDKEADFHQYQFNELEEASFTAGELESLDQQLDLLSNAESIRNALSRIYYDLEEGSDPVNSKIKSLTQSLQPYHAMHHELPSLIERLNSVNVELKDLAREAERMTETIDADPAAIERMNERIALGNRLLKKHGVRTTDELLQIHEQLKLKLQDVLNIDDAISKAMKDFEDAKKSATEKAMAMSAKRKAQIKPLEQKVNAMLVQVGMPNARIRVDLRPSELSYNGSDDIEFLFDANRKDNFQPLRKVASGGELSRLMLCIKSLVAASMDLPTLIFDEIDTGISGEAARQVGTIMKSLATSRQVICITHQPQIAGRADAHYLVYKNSSNKTVSTGVRLLSKDERVVAIAKMLGGEKPTEAALENAREMVMN